MKNISLLIPYYKDVNPLRMAELNKCLEINKKKNFKNIYLFGEYSGDLQINPQIKNVFCEGRPTYTQMFDLVRGLNASDELFVIANGDIFFTNIFLEELSNINFINNLGQKLFLALTRWDAINYQLEEDVFDSIFLDRVDSQDVWVFTGDIRIVADYELGVPGCDNKVAFCAYEAGYKVLNPSRDLKTYHLHQSNVKNYPKNSLGTGIFNYPAPYHTLQPTYLKDLK